MKLSCIGALAGLSAGVALLASTAQATIYTVDAINDVPSWLDTGIDASPSTTYDFTVIDPSTLWSAGAGAARSSTADGIPVPNPFGGQWTMLGYTFNFGALVGEDASHFFLIGTGPTILSGLSGGIHVGYWDSYYGDNSGTQTLSITTVPEPSTWAMMLAGFVGLGFAALGRGRKARIASALA
jgi:PEP-CTERM motif